MTEKSKAGRRKREPQNYDQRAELEVVPAPAESFALFKLAHGELGVEAICALGYDIRRGDKGAYAARPVLLGAMGEITGHDFVVINGCFASQLPVKGGAPMPIIEFLRSRRLLK